MKLTAEKDGNPRYFSVKLGWKERFDPKEIEILCARAIPQLIPPEVVQGRKNNKMRYNISLYSTLDFYLSCVLSKEQFAEVLLQCIQLFRQMQRLYLDYKKLVLDLDQIYVLLGERTLHFVFLPLANSTRNASIPDFFRKLVKKASRSTYEQVSFLDECTAFLDRPTAFSLDEFEHYIKGGNSGHVQPPVQQFVQIHASQLELVPKESPVYQPWGVSCPDPVVMNGAGMGGTTRLDRTMGDTVILSEQEAESKPRFFVTRIQTGERVEIVHSPFLFGTEASSVDYCVKGNAAVSRRHAEFTIQDGRCFVSDQKSTNKTCVNGQVLEPFQRIDLSNGDQVTLANEAFTFSREG